MTLSAGSASAQQSFCGPTPCATLGTATANTLTFDSNGESIDNDVNGIVRINRNDTGAVNIGLQDFDTTDAVTAGLITTDCSDTGSGTEDCDFTLSALSAGSFSSFLSSDADGNGIMTTQEWQISINNGVAPAATCVVGEMFIDTDETDDTNCATTVDNSLCLCTATDTWVSLPEKTTKSIFWGAGAVSSDSTNCANPAEVTINSGPKLWSIICTDNDASIMSGSVRMPDGWDAGTVTFELSYIQTAANTAALHTDVKAQCRNATTTVNSTYGSEVAIDDAVLTGSNALDQTTSAAVTANGTCAAGDMLFWQIALDAAGTLSAVATLNFIGVNMEYGWNPSD